MASLGAKEAKYQNKQCYKLNNPLGGIRALGDSGYAVTFLSGLVWLGDSIRNWLPAIMRQCSCSSQTKSRQARATDRVAHVRGLGSPFPIL